MDGSIRQNILTLLLKILVKTQGGALKVYEKPRWQGLEEAMTKPIFSAKKRLACSH